MTGAPSRSFLLGLIGTDLSLSRTPPMHEAEGLAQGYPTVYRRIDTLTERLQGRSLEELLGSAVNLGFDGLNITHPYKREVIDLLDEIDPAAAQLGSVNTVVIRDGRTAGHNTDVTGYGRGLAEQLPDVPKDSVVQVGAGGVGNAIAFALAAAGVKNLQIRDVDAGRAAELAEKVNTATGATVATGSGVEQVEEAIAVADGVVNATPLGMLSHPGTSFDTSCLTPAHWVSDVVYMPVSTQLLQEAEAIGCRTLPGTHMAVYQAVDAFELFTGLPADAERMRATFRSLG
ncbi:MAG TPA: shikimate dehydrogenase [Candidatus Corynebacterium avicola]|uniref:Quinate/shikimate dehydrogenase (NAD(+)) n=1 Tax=Candidatus Corynebacterium avicola TaxID=2838527 RepID=A0A9D1RPZ5_9CORY|nr:shikimate dehydrogenase [Candidatus Corynebacterium avicola]